MSSTQLRHAERTLEEIERQLESLNKLADSFRAVVAYYKANERDTESDSVSYGETLKSAIERILDQANEPIHPLEICKRLVIQSIDVHGRDPVNNIRAHMSGDLSKRFEPVGDGNWALRKWGLTTKEPKAVNTFEGIDGLPF